MTTPELTWVTEITTMLETLNALDDRRAEQIAKLDDDITQVWKELAELRDEVHELARRRPDRGTGRLWPVNDPDR